MGITATVSGNHSCLWGESVRDLARNQQCVWYALYIDKGKLKDRNGHSTGEKFKEYGEPEAAVLNVSPASGVITEDFSGIRTPYDRTMVTCDMECPINENSLIWIGCSPETDTGENRKHNYVVKRVARGLDNIMYGLSEVQIR